MGHTIEEYGDIMKAGAQSLSQCPTLTHGSCLLPVTSLSLSLQVSGFSDGLQPSQTVQH